MQLKLRMGITNYPPYSYIIPAIRMRYKVGRAGILLLRCTRSEAMELTAPFPCVLLCLFWSLVEVHCQTEYPYVSFMGMNLSNHSYVNLTLVGRDISDPGDTVRCHTDLESCCAGIQGSDRGDWYFPNGSVLAGAVAGGDINIRRAAQVIHLRRRNNATSPSGIYHCDIETVAVNDDGVDTITGETVYVGLYPRSGGNHFCTVLRLELSKTYKYT